MKINAEWLKAAGIRALKTVAQTAIATIGVSATMSEVNWLMVGSASLLAGILSLLTSVAGLPELEKPELKPDGSIIIDDSDPDVYGISVNFGRQTVEEMAKKDYVVLGVEVNEAGGEEPGEPVEAANDAGLR